MFVDINLLPQKEKKRSWALLLIITGLALVVVLMIALWFYYQSQVDKMDALQKELQTSQELRQIYETKAVPKQETPTELLEQAVTWAVDHQKETSDLLVEITALLPKRGFIQSFSYQETGDISLTVQFDSTRQAADFLNHLQASEYVKSTELESVTTSELENEEDLSIGLKEEEEMELPRYVASYTVEVDEKALRSNREKEEATS